VSRRERRAINNDAASTEGLDMSDEHGPSGSDTETRRERSPAFIALSLLAFVFVVMLAVYVTIPAKQHKAPPPDSTAQSIQDLQTSLQQAVDQMKALQQTVSSNQSETKQLSGEISALAGKLEALQQSFASAQQAPIAVLPTDPARPKRGVR
jgi:septal ring factor EnvC (AmiA/AmiB activator)